MNDVSSAVPMGGNMKVRLTLSHNIKQSGAVRGAAIAAFGDGIKEQLTCVRDTQVICRPDQFAIFMVERNRLGGCNSYKDLDVRLLDAPAFLNPVVDVTGHSYG